MSFLQIDSKLGLGYKKTRTIQKNFPHLPIDSFFFFLKEVGTVSPLWRKYDYKLIKLRGKIVHFESAGNSLAVHP